MNMKTEESEKDNLIEIEEYMKTANSSQPPQRKKFEKNDYKNISM
jgi:hypothetical protein